MTTYLLFLDLLLFLLHSLGVSVHYPLVAGLTGRMKAQTESVCIWFHHESMKLESLLPSLLPTVNNVATISGVWKCGIDGSYIAREYKSQYGTVRSTYIMLVNFDKKNLFKSFLPLNLYLNHE